MPLSIGRCHQVRYFVTSIDLTCRKCRATLCCRLLQMVIVACAESLSDLLAPHVRDGPPHS